MTGHALQAGSFQHDRLKLLGGHKPSDQPAGTEDGEAGAPRLAHRNARYGGGGDGDFEDS